MITYIVLGAVVLSWFALCAYAYWSADEPMRLPTQWETERKMQERLPPMRTLHADGTVEYVDVNHG